MKCTSKEWETFLEGFPEAHLLQTSAWGDLKSGFGWKIERIIAGKSGAQVLFKAIPGGFSIGYIPKGPLGQFTEELKKEIDLVCRENKAVFLKVEPDFWEDSDLSLTFCKPEWKPTKPIQPRRTIILPISGSEEEILAGMKQKTRYNIRLAEKREIKIRRSVDVRLFHEMMKITGSRDGIAVHAESYYQRAYDLFHKDGRCELLFANFENKPIAGMMVFAHGKTAWYMYGASTDVERNRMPTYLLQWEAIRWAKEKKCEYYDLWGIPDLEEEELEEFFTEKGSHEGLWGVYRFKRGFGGKIIRSVGAWDKEYLPALYKIYMQVMKLRGRQED